MHIYIKHWMEKFKVLSTRDKHPKSYFSRYIFNKKVSLFKGHLEVGASMRSSNGYMGRFGGGWQWELGFQTGSLKLSQIKEYGFTLIINLFVMTIRINYKTDKCIARGIRYAEERKQREENNDMH